MEAQDNKQRAREYLDALARDKRNGLDKYVADASLKEHIIVFEEGLPGYQVHEDDLIAEGDKVVLRGRVIGTHAGTLFGIPPSGRNVNVPLIIIYRYEDGRIVEHWMQADSMALMQQIGALPVPDASEH